VTALPLTAGSWPVASAPSAHWALAEPAPKVNQLTLTKLPLCGLAKVTYSVCTPVGCGEASPAGWWSSSASRWSS
jgi:hypothetical protein